MTEPAAPETTPVSPETVEWITNRNTMFSFSTHEMALEKRSDLYRDDFGHRPTAAGRYITWVVEQPPPVWHVVRVLKCVNCDRVVCMCPKQ